MTDYEILRDRLVALIVSSSKVLDMIPRWDYTAPFNEVEYGFIGVDEAYRRLEAEWSRLLEWQLEREGGTEA